MIETTKMEAFFKCQNAARGDLGKQLIADSVSNSDGHGILVDLSEFGFSRQGPRDNNDLWIWRYELSDDDELRRVTGVVTSTGTASVDRVYDDTDNLNYVLIGFDPRLVLDAMDTAYERMTLKKDLVLTLGGHDFDMEEEGEDAWNADLLNATVLKEEASPENKVTGTNVLKITLTAASGYVRSEQIRAVPGDNLVVAPCLRVSVGGPFTVRLWDDTNGAYFGSSQTYGGAEFAFLYLQGNNNIVPDGCDFWQLEIMGTADDDVAYLDSVTARAKGDTRYELGSTIDDTYKVPFIHRMRFTAAIANVEGQYAATKIQPAGDLVYNTHYQLQMQGTQATQQLLEIEPTVEMRTDIFYLATRRSRYRLEPWDFKTDVTTAPVGELVAYCMYDVSDLLAKETKDPYWLSAKLDWGQRLGEEVKPRSEVPYQPPREVFIVKI